LNIRIFYDGVGFRLRGWKRIKKLIDKVISEEGKISGDLNFILTDDITLREMNVKYLKHNYFTDVISFELGADRIIDGEVYISLDRVKINAKNYKVSYGNELLRVIIHGTLHLCGYDDKTDNERERMRKLEDFWIERFKTI
jgi:rRNA maturation RNase YbeY